MPYGKKAILGQIHCKKLHANITPESCLKYRESYRATRDKTHMCHGCPIGWAIKILENVEFSMLVIPEGPQYTETGLRVA